MGAFLCGCSHKETMLGFAKGGEQRQIVTKGTSVRSSLVPRVYHVYPQLVLVIHSLLPRIESFLHRNVLAHVVDECFAAFHGADEIE